MVQEVLAVGEVTHKAAAFYRVLMQTSIIALKLLGMDLPVAVVMVTIVVMAVIPGLPRKSTIQLLTTLMHHQCIPA